MKQIPRKPAELFWPKVVLKKWLNIKSQEPDFSADEGDDSDDSEKEEEVEYCESDDNEENGDDKLVDEASLFESNGFEAIPRRRRRNSETFRTQYINTKELRVCVGTWNLGGTLPPENLDIKDWLETDELADIYVIGLQEMVPLNASNIFGAEDHRPIPIWENIIREALNKRQPAKPKFKSYSAPSSPSKFNGIIDIEDELLNETDSDDEIYQSYDEEIGNDEVMTRSETDELNTLRELELEKQFSSPKRFDRLNCLKMEDGMKNSEASAIPQQKRMLTKTLSGIERIGLNWPEPPSYFRSVKSFRDTKSFRACNSFRPSLIGDRKSSDRKSSEGTGFVQKLSLESIRSEKKSPFVRIVSKQMVGIFISIWVRRSLRRHIQNLKISTVGVGIMGYIGNKGSVSVSMSIYQTPFCFICTHLTSGEKEGDELKRNADVHEIHRRTQFRTVSGIGLPKAIHDHERIIWLGDLNYRISLPYIKTRELISKKEWPKLLEHDQLVRELKKGCAFDGWTEGILNFPPTYKYEQNSEKYCGEDPKAGRRNPAWCDRILSFGKGMRLLNYKRIENKLSDHRPVTAIYMAEVEVFSHRKLQKALTFTDAELEEEDLENIKFNIGLSRLRFEEDLTDRER